MKQHTSLVVLFLILILLRSQISISGSHTDKNRIPEDFDNSTLPRQTSADGLQNSSWPMKCHDTRHTSQSPYSTKDNPHTEKWRFRTIWKGSAIESGPIIDDKGIIYFGSIGLDQKLYALYPNGTKKWHYQFDDAASICCTPAITEDGIIYVASRDHNLHAINPNGTRKWSFNAGDTIASSPAIAIDGTTYFGCYNKYIYAVNPDGTLKWRYPTGFIVISDPAVGVDGTVYIGSGDHYLYALYPNGTLKWRYLTDAEVKGHPSIATDGTIYISSTGNYLYALYPNGTLKWKYSGGGDEASAAIAEDDTIYIGNKFLHAIYPNGTKKWKIDVGPNIDQGSPAISADGTIYVGAGKYIIAVNSNGTEKMRKQISNLWIRSSPCIGWDGTIYIGSSWDGIDIDDERGYLHAFGPAPLSVDAGGPYDGIAERPVQFYSTTFGGGLPYNYIWDFGDGNQSYTEHPQHTYIRSGNYTITFTVRDSNGNTSTDLTYALIKTGYPTVRIIKPANSLYLCNNQILPTKIPIIIGRINIEVKAYQEEAGIEKVVFYIDDVIQFRDYEEPYQWTWENRSFSFHEISAYAKSNDGRGRGTSINVLKIF